MRNTFKKVIITYFVLIFLIFMFKWIIQGTNYIWITNNEIKLFMDLFDKPFNDIIIQIKSLGTSSNIFDTIFNVIKTIGMITILPVRLGGLLITWLFS